LRRTRTPPDVFAATLPSSRENCSTSSSIRKRARERCLAHSTSSPRRFWSLPSVLRQEARPRMSPGSNRNRLRRRSRSRVDALRSQAGSQEGRRGSTRVGMDRPVVTLAAKELSVAANTTQARLGSSIASTLPDVMKERLTAPGDRIGEYSGRMRAAEGYGASEASRRKQQGPPSPWKPSEKTRVAKTITPRRREDQMQPQRVRRHRLAQTPDGDRPA